MTLFLATEDLESEVQDYEDYEVFGIPDPQDGEMPWPGDETDLEPNFVSESAQDADQVKNLNKVLNTIESIESVRDTLYTIKLSGGEFSKEHNDLLMGRISYAYAKNGLNEPFPFHITQESFSGVLGHDHAINLAIEQLDARIEELSTEANGFFSRFWRKTKEFFGREINRVDRIRDDISTLIEEVQNTPDWGKGGEVNVKSVMGLTLGNKFDMAGVISRLDGVCSNYLRHGRFMDMYYNDLDKVVRIADNMDWSNREDNIKKLKNANLFGLGKPFVEENSEGKFRHFTCRFSDLCSITFPMPNGSQELIPHNPFSSQDSDIQFTKGNKARAKESHGGTLPRMSKQELLNNLNAFMKMLNGLPNASEFDTIAKNIKKQVAMLNNKGGILRKHQADDVSWNEEDWKRLGGSLVVPWIALVVGGFGALMALSTIRTVAALVNYLSHGLSDMNEFNVARNDITNSNSFVQGGANNLSHVLIHGLFLKKYTNSFENKLTLYFIGVYREMYAHLKATSSSLLSYGYACIGDSNKI